MGLFDKRDKKRGGQDDFDSPVEQIDLSSMASTPAPAARPAPTAAAGAPALPTARSPEPTRASESAQENKPMRGTPEHDDYGIDRAIELMRTLPSENIELVVQVVKFSLESVGVKLPTIIEDAIRRQKDIQGRIGVLRTEIADLEQEIKVRKDEIERLDADHKETSMVRERLELAENIGKPRSEPMAATASGPTPMAASSSGPLRARPSNPPPAGTVPAATPAPGLGSSSSTSSPIKK